MTPQEYAELLQFIHENHGWHAMFGLDKREGNKFIKYVDANFDTRDGSVWRVNLRGGCGGVDGKEFRGKNIKEDIYKWLNDDV